MPQRRRPYRLQVKLSSDEHDALAARAAEAGVSKSQLVRSALRTALADQATPAEALTRTEALELLAAQAREGSSIAAAALARELRLEPIESSEPAVSVGVVKLADLPPGVLRAVK
jgi:Mobilization protein NikA